MSILGNVHFVESVSKLIEERGRGGARKARNGEEIACSQASQERESCTEGFQLQSTKCRQFVSINQPWIWMGMHRKYCLLSLNLFQRPQLTRRSGSKV